MGININTDCFIANADKEGLFEKQTDLDGVAFILDKMRYDKRLNDYRHAAYMFATIKHETAHTYMPIEEYDNKAKTYLKSKKYYPYYGRGYVQLTWRSNYMKYSKELGIDIVNNVELAKIPEVAYEIMSIGMLDKPTFTGVNLHKYINDNQTDYYNARRVINGTSGAGYVEKLAVRFDKVIRPCLTNSLPVNGKGLFAGIAVLGVIGYFLITG